MTQGRIRALTKPKLLKQARAKGILTEIGVFMDNHASDAIKELQVYPPPRPDSTYVRTNTLKWSWGIPRLSSTNEGLVVTITNNAVDPYGHHYSTFVHGDREGEGQLRIHEETGWPLVHDVLARGYREGLRRLIRDLLS